jgi:hypothetical protein
LKASVKKLALFTFGEPYAIGKKSYLNSMNRFTFSGVIAGTATFLTIFGFWAKLTHQAYAEKRPATGMWPLAICAAVYAYFMFANITIK